MHRLAGERAPRRAGAHAGVRRRRRDLHVQGRGGGPEPRLARRSSPHRGPRRRSSSGSRRSAAKRPSRRARTRSRGRRGARRCRCSGWCRPTRWPRSPTSCTSRTSPRCTPRWGRGTPAPGTSSSGSRRCSAARSRPRRTSPSGPRRRRCGSAPAARPASSCGATTATSAISTRSSRAAARRCPATRSWASSPAAAASRCTGWTAPTPVTCTARRADRRRGVVGVAGLGVPRGHPGRGAGSAPAAVDITKVLADEKVNILSASVATSKDRVAISRFSFEMGDPKHLGHVLSAVRQSYHANCCLGLGVT